MQVRTYLLFAGEDPGGTLVSCLTQSGSGRRSNNEVPRNLRCPTPSRNSRKNNLSVTSSPKLLQQQKKLLRLYVFVFQRGILVEAGSGSL